MPARKNKETLKGVADGVINKGKHIKRKREGDKWRRSVQTKYNWQVTASTAPSKLEIHGMVRFRLDENESSAMRQYNLGACLYEVGHTKARLMHC